VAELQALQTRWQFDIETRDIDEDPVWQARYNTLVPVLTLDDKEICHYFLDPDKLAVYFE